MNKRYEDLTFKEKMTLLNKAGNTFESMDYLKTPSAKSKPKKKR